MKALPWNVQILSIAFELASKFANSVFRYTVNVFHRESANRFRNYMHVYREKSRRYIKMKTKTEIEGTIRASKFHSRSNDFRLISDRTTGTSVYWGAALRPGVVVRGFKLLQSLDIRADARRRSYGDPTEIRRWPGLRNESALLPVFGSRARSYRRPTYRRRSEKWHLGGFAELSRCQELYAGLGKGIAEFSDWPLTDTMTR